MFVMKLIGLVIILVQYATTVAASTSGYTNGWNIDKVITNEECIENIENLSNKFTDLELEIKKLTAIQAPKPEIDINGLLNKNMLLIDINQNISRTVIDLLNTNSLAWKQVVQIQQEKENLNVELINLRHDYEELKKKNECNQTIGGLGLTTIGEKSYYFERFLSLTWEEAKKFCIAHQMQLLSIETEEENIALENYFRKTFTDVTDKWWFWTSGSKNQQGSWIWNSTNQPFNFTTFSKLRPESKHNRVYTLKNDNKLQWDNWESTWKSRFICELP